MSEVWATVCGSGFTDTMAAAVCTNIGLPAEGLLLALYVDTIWGHTQMLLFTLYDIGNCLRAKDKT